MQRRTARTVLVVLVLGLAGCATSATTSPGEDVGTPPPARPGTTSETLVALASDGIVEVDPVTGETLQRHDVATGEGLVDVELVPSRDVALVTRRLGEGDAEVVEVALDGTDSRVRHAGAHPTVTGDGSRVALTRRVGTTDRLELVVASHRVLPIDRSGSLRGASHVVPPTSVGAALTAPAFHSSGVLTVAEGCCRPDDHTSWRLLDVTVEADTATLDAAEW